MLPKILTDAERCYPFPLGLVLVQPVAVLVARLPERPADAVDGVVEVAQAWKGSWTISETKRTLS